ncbi:AraC family transcriptional regulator ligand-binding domain-containing protein [Shimia sp. SDUM112013]|uniref:AraC family transcriptional regulator n=1 Tax=Shimia sp. SDUM112013 TaxID=3136160 RepID=UPI0032EC1C40
MPTPPIYAANPTQLATVSWAFVEDWIAGLQTCCNAAHLDSILERAGLQSSSGQHARRVTLDQMVRLYQIAAIETEDEMTGLWSRTIRPRALQHLLTTIRESTSLAAALYRYSTFWNLLLDDYRFELETGDATTALHLLPRGRQQSQRFGHMLILKLAHGLASWMAGYEVRVQAVQFGFGRPRFAPDYNVIFPAPVRFGAPHSAIVFAARTIDPFGPRTNADLHAFLESAPRDWLFTGMREHTQSLRVREFLYRTDWQEAYLENAARALKVTPRTLMRRLSAEDSSFQAIKDDLRRDLAIRGLQAGDKSIEEISQDVGFSSSANFHRAFLRWTGVTPSSYRQSMK